MMPTEVEIQAVEKALTRLFGATPESWRKEAIAVIAAAARARLPIDQATQIPAAEGEREVCQCPVCGRSHWRPAHSPRSDVAPLLSHAHGSTRHRLSPAFSGPEAWT
jgi:hypothetical protein